MYTVIPTEQFEKDVKYYIKKKGFRHIGEDIKAITDELEKGNLIGTEIPSLKIPTGGHTFKVRSVNTDTKEGQSNGYRIIYYVVRDDVEVYLLTIYYKKDDNRIPTNQEIIDMVEKYCI
jgi:mRNA-degrading endonuclease RelE of RelBE toxin-antitoxin system